MNLNTATKILGDSLKYAEKIFKSKPYFFLNEHDFLAFLYYDLIKRLDEQDGNVIHTTSVHCKVGAYSNGSYDFQPDISIFNTKKFKYNCKIDGKKRDFYFDNRLIGIEIKHCLNNTEGKVIKKIKDDYDKLKKKKEGGAYLVMFDNNSRLDETRLIQLQKNHHKLSIKIVYISQKKEMICVMNSKLCDLYD
ncbi:hypothetical protein HYX00_04030 [Candidatus Woesearchaeota archaeon]|nr:hypothetical protein [Candidatus Woesearchaeota archaeon]